MTRHLNTVREHKCISGNNLHGKHSPGSCCCIATEAIKKEVQPFFFSFFFWNSLQPSAVQWWSRLFYQYLGRTHTIACTQRATFIRSEVHSLKSLCLPEVCCIILVGHKRLGGYSITSLSLCVRRSIGFHLLWSPDAAWLPQTPTAQSAIMTQKQERQSTRMRFSLLFKYATEDWVSPIKKHRVSETCMFASKTASAPAGAWSLMAWCATARI